MRALDLPSDFPTSKECQELFRAWIDRGKISISICHDLPSDWRKPEEAWAMLLSDIFHHVIEGIVAATTHPREDVLHRISHAFEIAVKSKRECRAGITKEFTDSFRELPTPDIVGDETSVEMARIFVLEGSIGTIVRVGGWLPDKEESMWAGVLYDLACLVADSIQPKRPKTTRRQLLKSLRHFLRNPTTEYRGKFYE